MKGDPLVLRSLTRRILGAALSILAAALLSSNAEAAERGVHQFLETAVSPDGARVASVEGDSSPSGGEPIVRTLTIRTSDGRSANSVALPCGGARECWPSSPLWRPDGKSLVFALRTPGTHARSLYSAAADGSHLVKMLTFNGTIDQLRFGPDGRLAMLATASANKEVGATQAGAPVTGDLRGPVQEQRIAIFDQGQLRWASPPELFVYEYDWLPNGTGFVGTAAPGNGDDNWWVAKLYRFRSGDRGGTIIFAPPDARHQIADPVVSKDGTVAFISGLMSDFGSTGGDVFTLPSGGGNAVDITPGMHASARSLAWGCDGHLHAEFLAGAATELDEFPDASRPGAPGVLWQGEETLLGENAGVSLGCPSQMTAAVHQSFVHPPEIEIGAVGHWHNLTKTNAGYTAALRARSIGWKNEGFALQGWLLLPSGARGKLPLITIVHGGPAAATTPHFIGPGTIRALLEEHYSLFLPNPRGSFGGGEAFTAANVRDFGHGDLSDILTGIDAASREAPIDPDRLGIMGGSYGGFMTMWAVTQTHRFKAGVAAAGISDWLSYYGENGIDQWMIPYFGASVYDDPAVYARSSAINYIHNVRTPVFAYVGADDIECPAPQTQEFWHALHDLGVPTSYAIYPGEGHGLRDPAHIADAQARTLAWFKRYLR